jgi:hypothetical protein
MATWTLFAATIGMLVAPGRPAGAQSSPDPAPREELAQVPSTPAPRFAAPARVLAGSSYAGAARRYPSPVLHDVNRDGLADLVLGDLHGSVTVSLREAGEGPVRFGAETPLYFSDGSELVFSNW